jgi:predicted DNA-binding protein
MNGQKYRAQILLEPEQHQKLTEIAVRSGRSISAVVREAVTEYMVARSEENVRERRMKALQKIKQHREEMLAKRGGIPIEIDVVELISQMREERDNELLAAVGNLARHRRGR